MIAFHLGHVWIDGQADMTFGYLYSPRKGKRLAIETARPMSALTLILTGTAESIAAPNRLERARPRVDFTCQLNAIAALKIAPYAPLAYALL